MTAFSPVAGAATGTTGTAFPAATSGGWTTDGQIGTATARKVADKQARFFLSRSEPPRRLELPSIRTAFSARARLSMDRGILDFADLQKLCSPNGPQPRASTVRHWADRQGIPYKSDARGGIFTTREAINQALGVRGSAPEMPGHVEDLA